MAKLVINPTSASKKEIPIVSRVISIGRDPSNDLVLSDTMVSRRHAILEQRDDGFVIRDNNSSNGTMVNGDRLDDEKTLQDGDLVAIGSSRLLFQLDDNADASTAPPRPIGSETREVPTGGADPTPAPSSVGRNCPKCGTASTALDKFCRSCGHKLDAEPASAVCAGCGTRVRLPAEFCGNCGRALAPRAKARPAAAPSPAGGAAPSPARREAPRPVTGAHGRHSQAGIGVRLVAGLVDCMILGIPILLVALVWVTVSAPAPGTGTRPISSAFVLIGGTAFVILAAVYFIVFWGLRGATPGMSLLGLTVETESGETPIGVGRATVRAFVAFLGLLPLGLGFLRIAIASDGLAIQDRLTETRVIGNQ